MAGREGRNENKTEIRQGLGNSTRPQLFCLPRSCHTQQPGVDGYATSEIAGKILITKFPKFLEETKKEKEERGKKEKVEEKEEEKRILRNKKRTTPSRNDLVRAKIQTTKKTKNDTRRVRSLRRNHDRSSASIFLLSSAPRCWCSRARLT